MSPKEFEVKVAEHFKAQGYETTVTTYSNDYGIDVIATKGEEKLAIQAKMYGGSTRKVNREAMMQLHGAMKYQDCTKAVMVTDGEVMKDAQKVAEKLGMEIVYLNKEMTQKETSDEKAMQPHNDEYPTAIMSFYEMWEKYVMPLQGKKIENDGLVNTIEKVDKGGITRITSTGNESEISIDEFKKAYNLLKENEIVTRAEINQHTNRCASGIVLVLSKVPFIGYQEKPKAIYIKKEK
ncbi:MAG: restriction endonuclease [Prevotella sp.]|nr:restriction endonuclease [Prevotella sp.]